MLFKYLGMCKTVADKQHKAINVPMWPGCEGCSLHPLELDAAECLTTCRSRTFKDQPIEVYYKAARESYPGMRALPSHYLQVGKKLFMVEIPDEDCISNPGIMPWTVSTKSAEQCKEDLSFFSGCGIDFTTKRAAQAYIDSRKVGK